MSTASERVAEFLRQWAMGRDKSDLIYGVLFDPKKDETADLLASDLQELLDEIETSRNIISTARSDSPITISGIDFEAAVPADTEVMFWLSPEKYDWIAVRLSAGLEENSLHVRSAGSGRSLNVQPDSTNTLDLTIRRSY